MARRLTRSLWLAIGVVLLFVPFLPITTRGGADTGPLWWPHVGAWVVGVTTILIFGVIAGRMAAAAAPYHRFRVKVSPTLLVIAATVLQFAASVYAMTQIFARNPHLVDEIAQLFHARIFAAGRLAAPMPEPPEFFLFLNTFLADGQWVSQYPPGHPMLLAIGFLLGIEWLINPLLSATCVALVFLLARRLYGPKTAMVATFLWASSGWVIFMSGTYQNHVSALTLALVSWVTLLGVRHPKPMHGVVAGFALGFLAAIRPLDAVAASIPIGVWIFQRKAVRSIPWVVLGATPCVLLVGFLNWKLFGSPATFGYTALYGESHGLGFHRDPWGWTFTPVDALRNAFHAIRRLNIYLFEWPVPAVLPLGMWAMLGGPRHRDLLLAAGLIALPICYFFYWHSGFYIGPRFYYGMTPFLAIGTARSWKWLSRRARRVNLPRFRADLAVNWMAIAIVTWGVLGLLPARATSYKNQFPTAKLHPERTLKERGVSRALVLIPESWLSRTISGLWAAGAPAGLVERAIGQLDGCDLHHLLVTVNRSDLSPTDLSVRLETMIARQETPVPPFGGAPDPALRLRDDRAVDSTCFHELRRDFDGFSLYGQFAWRNAVDLQTGLVFARDLYEKNDSLLDRYEGWDVWRYAPPSDDPTGVPVLTPYINAESEM